MAEPQWTLQRTDDGSVTLAHPLHGETCHSRSGAWTEARERYAGPCRLADRIQPGAVHLLDVGTGLGFNLAAALEALEGTGRPLNAVSLEIDPGVIERTIGLLGDPAGTAVTETAPDGFLKWHRPVCIALERVLADQQLARGAGVLFPGRLGRLRVLIGDARETLAAEPCKKAYDAVFLDPFSPGVDGSLWTDAFLQGIAVRMAPGSWLSTYTASAAVRVSLMDAGLRVGPGPRVGAKASGTLASPDLDPGPFDAKTVRRLERRARPH